MLPRLKCPVIALEEHYWDKELAAQFVGGEGVRDPDMLKRLHDLGELRIKEMDEAGIDMQVLSHGAPSAQKLAGADARSTLDARVNDRLAAVVHRQPEALCRLRGACRPAIPRRPPTSSSARDQARLQGRDDARPVQRRVPRRQAVLADLRARRGARRADLFASVDAAAGGDGRLLQGLRQGLPDGGARRLGLHGRDRDHGDPHGAVGRVRQAIPTSRSSSATSARRCRSWSGASTRRIARPGAAKTISFRDVFCNNF